jgi:hypothetical protein
LEDGLVPISVLLGSERLAGPSCRGLWAFSNSLITPIWEGCLARWRLPVDYLLEAKRFIQRAREAYSPEVRNQHLDMADWCIARAMAEMGSPQARAAAKPS